MSFVRSSLGVVTMRGVRGAAALAALAVLASCGGNVSRAEPYVPDKLVAFGDEMSLIESNGHKYTVNAVDATDTSLFVCAGNPVWSQYVAQGYGFVFSQCNPTGVTPTAFNFAAVGATVDTVATQVTNNSAGFNNKTLVTLMAGMYDVIYAYNQVKSNLWTSAAALAYADSKGAQYAGLVDQLTNGGKGARVLFSFLPDISYSPFAFAEEAALPGVGRQQLIRDLVRHFNDEARIKVVNNGRWVASVDADVSVVTSYNAFVAGGSSGFSDVTTAGCSTPLPNCTTATLKPLSTTTSPVYMWADETRMGAGLQVQIGNAALYKAQNNPF